MEKLCLWCGEAHRELDAFRNGGFLDETGLLLASQQASRCDTITKREELANEIEASGDC